LAVTTFPWHFGKLSLLVVSLAASLQGNHPWGPEPPRKLISLSFYPWVCLLDGLCQGNVVTAKKSSLLDGL
jgi:hypothetical protein